jgi:hypothetical protein
MKQKAINTITTAGEATDIAIEWQHWASEQDLSYGELVEWQSYFQQLADKFDLTDEFQENGIL